MGNLQGQQLEALTAGAEAYATDPELGVQIEKVLDAGIIESPLLQEFDEDDIKEARILFPFNCGLDSEKSGLEDFQSRFDSMAKELWQAGFTTPQKKFDMLKQGDFKNVILPQNKEAFDFMSKMDGKCKLLITRFLARNPAGANNQESFFSLMAKELDSHEQVQFYEGCLNSKMMMTELQPFSESDIDQLLAESIDCEPKDLFSKSVLCFFKDVRAKIFAKRIEMTIDTTRDAKFRAKLIELFFKNATIRADPSALLKATDLAIKHKVSLVKHMEYFCKQSEIPSTGQDGEEGDNFEMVDEEQILGHVEFERDDDTTTKCDKFLKLKKQWYWYSEHAGMGKATCSNEFGFIDSKKLIDVDDNYKEAQIFTMKDRLYIRHSGRTDQPFEELDKMTLKIKADQTPFTGKDGKEVPLQWTPLDQEPAADAAEVGQRWARACPLFFDGKKLHAMVVYKSTIEDDSVVKLVLETYDIKDHEMWLVNEVTLKDKTLTENFFSKYTEVSIRLQAATIVCDSQHIYYHSENVDGIFDYKTGKNLIEDGSSSTIATYDPQSGYFFDMDICSYSWLRKWRRPGFKCRVVSDDGLPEMPIVFDQIKGQILQASKQAKSSQPPKQSVSGNLLRDALCSGLGQDQDVQAKLVDSGAQQAEESKVQDLHGMTKAIVLSVMGTQCSTNLKTIENLGIKSIPDDKLLNYFKTPFAVHVIDDYLSVLIGQISAFKPKLDLNSTVSLSQMLSLCKLLLTNLLSLRKLRIEIRDILTDSAVKDLTNLAQNHLQDVITKVKSQIKSLAKPADKIPPKDALLLNFEPIIVRLLDQIKIVAPEKNTGKLDYLLESLKALNQGQEQEQIADLKEKLAILDSLCDSEMIKFLLQQDVTVLNKLKEILMQSLGILNSVVQRQVNQALDKQALSADPSKFAPLLASFIQVCVSEMQVALCNHKMVIQACKASTVKEQKQKAVTAQSKLEILEPIFYETFIQVSTYFKEQMFLLTEQFWAKSIQEWDSESDWKECYDKLLKLINGENGENNLARVLTELALGVSSYIPNVTWLDEISEAIKNCIIGSNHFIAMCHNYPTDVVDKLMACNTVVPYLVNFQRHMNYALGNVACQLIQRNYGEENDDEKAESLSKLNILQGGIEKRYIPVLSDMTKQQIEGSFKITHSKELKDLSYKKANEVVKTDEDNLMEMMIDNSKSSKASDGIALATEIALASLQTGLQTNKKGFVPHARLGGEQGMRLNRAAFCVIVKFSCMIPTFKRLVMKVEALLSKVKGAKDQGQEAMKLLIDSKSGAFDSCLTKWKEASQMRKWTQFIKLTISENTMKAASEKMKEELAEKNPSSGFSGQFSEEEKREVEKRSNAAFDKELIEKYDQVVNKAKFLVKLQVPEAFIKARQALEAKTEQDISQKKDNVQQTPRSSRQHHQGDSISVLNRSNKQTTVLVNSGEIKAKDTEVDWRDRLAKWRKIQKASEAVNSLTDKNQSVFQSCSISVMGCLQASFTAEQMQKQVEDSLVNGLRRSAGLNLISFAMEQTHSDELFYESLQWFSGSLRFNKGKTTHYLDGLQGCGVEAEQGIRKQFFNIIVRVLWQLRRSTKDDKQDRLVFLINAICCWDYKLDDHEYLVKLNIVPDLTKPNDDPLHPISLAWGNLREHIMFDLDKSSDFSLPARLNQAFIFFVKTTIASVLVDQSGASIEVGAETAQSRMIQHQVAFDKTATETLIKQILSTIESNFERYLLAEIGNSEKGDTRFKLDAETTEVSQSEDTLLYDTKMIVEAQGGKEIMEAKRAMAAHNQKLKVNKFIEKVTTEEITRGSPLYTALKSLIGKRCEKTIEHVVQRKSSAIDAIERKTWQELCLEEPNLTLEQIQEITKVEPDVWEKALLQISDDSDDILNETKPSGETNQARMTKLVEQELGNCDNFIALMQDMKVYSNQSVFCFMDSLDTYLSLARGITSAAAFCIVEKVCEPHFLSVLIRLSVSSTPRICFMAHKLLQLILAFDLPLEVLEEAVSQALAYKPSKIYNLCYQNNVRKLLDLKSPLEFKGSKFLQLYFNELQAMKVASYFNYNQNEAGANTIWDEAIRTIRVSAVVIEKNIKIKQIFDDTLEEVFLNRIETLNESQIDAIMSLIPEAQNERIAVGTPCMSADGKRFTVIGVTKDTDSFDKLYSNIEFRTDKTYLAGLSYDVVALEQQEIMLKVDTSQVRTLIDLDEQQAIAGARESIMMNSGVAKKLISILAKPRKDQKDYFAHDLLKTSIIRGYYALSWTLGDECIAFLQSLGPQADLIKCLLTEATNNPISNDAKDKSETQLEVMKDHTNNMLSQMVEGETYYKYKAKLVGKSSLEVEGSVKRDSDIHKTQKSTFQIKEMFGNSEVDEEFGPIAPESAFDIEESDYKGRALFTMSSQKLNQFMPFSVKQMKDIKAIITDDANSLDGFFDRCMLYKKKGLLIEDNFDKWTFIVLEKTAFDELETKILSPVLEWDEMSDAKDTPETELVVALANSAPLDSQDYLTKLTLDEWTMAENPESEAPNYLHLWTKGVNSECESFNDPWVLQTQIDDRLRHIYSLKLLMALFAANQTKSGSDLTAMFDDKVFTSKVCNLIHLNCIRIMQVYETFNNTIYKTQGLDEIRCMLKALKDNTNFREHFTKDLIVRGIHWFDLWIKEKDSDDADSRSFQMSIEQFKQNSMQIVSAGLHPSVLIYLTQDLFDLGYFGSSPAEQIKNLKEVFNLCLSFAKINSNESQVGYEITKQLLQTASTISKILTSESMLAKEKQGVTLELLSPILSEKLLRQLISITKDIETPAQLKDNIDTKHNDILVLIISIVQNFNKIYVALSDEARNAINEESPWLTDLLQNILGCIKTLQEGASFKTMVNEYVLDLLCDKNPDTVKHICTSYRTQGPMAKNMQFEKELVAEKIPMIINAESYGAASALQIENEAGEKKLFLKGQKVDAIFEVAAGTKVKLSYPGQVNEIKLSGNLTSQGFESDGMELIQDHQIATTVDKVHACSQGAVYESPEGALFRFGHRYGGKDIKKLERVGIPQEISGIAKVTVGKFVRLILTKDGKIFAEGQSRYYSLGQVTMIENFTDITDLFPLKSDEKIIDVAHGSKEMAAVTNQGRVLARGYMFFRIFDYEVRRNEYNNEDYTFEIDLPDGHKAENLWMCRKNKTLFVTAASQDGSTKKTFRATECLDSDYFEQTDRFVALDVPEGVYFVSIVCQKILTCCIDQKGQLWLFGEILRTAGQQDAANKIYADFEADQPLKPLQVKWFSDKGLKVVKADCGTNHVVVQTVDAQGKKALYGIRDTKSDHTALKLFGVPSKSTDECINELDIANETVVDFGCFNAGTTYILSQEVAEQKSIIPEKPEARGLIHFYKESASSASWKFVTNEEYQAKKSQLPEICFASSQIIKDFTEQKFPDLHSLNCQPAQTYELGKGSEGFESKSNEALYCARYTNQSGTVTKIYAHETEMLSNTFQRHDMLALIWYRVKKPIKNLDQLLKPFDLSKYFDLVDQPKETYIQFRQQSVAQAEIDKLAKTAGGQAAIKSLTTDFSKEANTELQRLISNQLEKNEESDIRLWFYDLDPISVGLDEKSVRATQHLKDISDSMIEKRKNMILEFSQSWVALTNYINKTQLFKDGSLSQLVASTSYLVPDFITNKVVDQILYAGSPNYDEPDVTVSRRKALMFTERNLVDHTGKFSIFGQIMHENLKEDSELTNFRKFDVDKKAFNVKFLSEGGIDDGGLFRDAIVNIATELQSHILPLLMKTPNNRNDHGNGRECFILNGSSRSPTHLKMLKYLGAMIGFNILSKSPLPINMAPFFWKQITGQETMSLEDLDGIDSYSCQMLTNMKQYSGFLSEEEFQASIDQTFTTVLSNGDEVSLCPGGETKKVTKANLEEFISLVLKARASESSMQAQAVRSGLEIPMDKKSYLLALFSWQAIEGRACGEKKLDVEKLKSITTYPQCDDNHRIIGRFWRVFEAFTEEEKGLYLKFVWGRSRLPIDCSTLKNKHQVRLEESLDSQAFPKSHTCYFQLDIPDYKTDEMCSKRLLQAATLCGQIDDDTDPVEEDE